MKWIRIGFLVMIFLLCIPRTVHAQDTGSIFFYQWDAQGEAILEKQEIEFLQESSVETKATILFYTLFHPLQSEIITYVPQGTHLLQVDYKDEILTLYLSPEAEKCFSGESGRLFLQQIQKTAYSISEIRGIIILIQDREIPLLEETAF